MWLLMWLSSPLSMHGTTAGGLWAFSLLPTNQPPAFANNINRIDHNLISTSSFLPYTPPSPSQPQQHHPLQICTILLPRVLLKAVLPSHCCCRLHNSPCFGVESRYSPPVPEPTSWPRLQLFSPSRQASEVACFTSPKWQLLHRLQRAPALRQLLSTAHGTMPTSPILLVDPAA